MISKDFSYSRELEAVLHEARSLAKSTRRRLCSAHILLALFTAPNQAQQYLREQDVDEDALLAKLSRVEDDPPELMESIMDRAARMAEGRHTSTLTSLHLLAAITGFKDCAGYRLMRQTGANMAQIRNRALGLFLGDELPRRFRVKTGETLRVQPDQPKPAVSKRAETRANIGVHPSLARESSRVRTTQTTQKPKTQPPKETTTGKRALQKDLAERLFKKSVSKLPAVGKKVTTPKKKAPPVRPKQKAKTKQDLGEKYELSAEQFPTLTRFGRNLTAEAQRGRIDPVVGRTKEIGQLIDILNKRRANNPLLLGDAGVGKTAVVEGLAQVIVDASSSSGLEGRVIIEIDAGRFFGGTGLRGSLAERLTSLKEEVEKTEGRAIVFLDEIHRWLGSASADSALDGVEELKPALARGVFPCVGATTYEEYRKSFENDPAFSRRFQIVRVEEPTVEETIEILHGVCDAYAKHHNVEFDDVALEAAGRLSHRYLTERKNPEKALAVLDLAGSKARRLATDSTSQETNESDEDEPVKPTVDDSIVAEVVAEMSGIPASKLLMSERERFLRMEDHLMKAIVGHERVLSRIAHVLRRNYAGFINDRTIGSFLFLGPTGVGKTETAKVLAGFLFHSADALLAIDMSEYSESHSVARLIGSPPGYVGHESGGILTESIRRTPYQIVLFDEIEKANSAVAHLLLQILDEGRLTDSRGRTADFSNTVVIMTSNLGADEASSHDTKVGFSQQNKRRNDLADRVIAAVRKRIEPELWNRIDEPLVFEPLTRNQIERIAHLKLQQSSRRLLDESGIAYSATEAVVDFLIEHGGFDAKLGARPIRRVLERYVEGPIADLILRGDVHAPAEIEVGVEGGELVFDVS